MVREVIAHLRFEGVVIMKKPISIYSLIYILKVPQYPFPPMPTTNPQDTEIQLIRYYELVFECQGEKVFASDTDYYFDFRGVRE